MQTAKEIAHTREQRQTQADIRKRHFLWELGDEAIDAVTQPECVTGIDWPGRAFLRSPVRSVHHATGIPHWRARTMSVPRPPSAMGITGTDVSKEAAAMTLSDDNFASIFAAVEEGRGVLGNIKKYLMFLLFVQHRRGWLDGLSLAGGVATALEPVQILYVNLATDGLPGLALAVDPPEPDLMRREQRNPRSGVFTRPVVILMIVGGLWSTAVNLGVFAWALNSGRNAAEAMTMTFVSRVLIRFFKAYNFRSGPSSRHKRAQVSSKRRNCS